MDAQAVIEQLAASGAPVKLTDVYTAETDANHLLGRPGQYTSKAAFTDTRISAEDTSELEKGDVGLGGGIEVFDTNAQAVARATYIQKIVQAAPVLGLEYDYVAGAVL